MVGGAFFARRRGDALGGVRYFLRELDVALTFWKMPKNKGQHGQRRESTPILAHCWWFGLMRHQFLRDVSLAVAKASQTAVGLVAQRCPLLAENGLR